MITNRRRSLPDPPTPLWFKAWFAFCLLAGLSVLGFVAWAIIRLLDILAAK